MSKHIEGLVETSLNLGQLTCEGNELKATFALRSSVNEEKMKLARKLEETASAFGGV